MQRSSSAPVAEQNEKIKNVHAAVPVEVSNRHTTRRIRRCRSPLFQQDEQVVRVGRTIVIQVRQRLIDGREYNGDDFASLRCSTKQSAVIAGPCDRGDAHSCWKSSDEIAEQMKLSVLFDVRMPCLCGFCANAAGYLPSVVDAGRLDGIHALRLGHHLEAEFRCPVEASIPSAGTILE